MPVPTAVPPCARHSSRGSQARSRSMPFSICARQPDSSWASVTRHRIHQMRAAGLDDLADLGLLGAMRRRQMRQRRQQLLAQQQRRATWIAVGITSLLLWPMLT